MATDSILWYATRGAGIVSLLLLTAVALLGILAAVRWHIPAWPRFLTTGLHRNLALLSVVFLLVHIVTAVVDPYTSLGPIAALIPFASSYRTLWLGLGAVSMDLGVAIVATSLIRARLGQRTWRAIHWLAYAAWPMAVLHSVGTGSDTSALWMRLVYTACAALVLGAVAWRVSIQRGELSRLPAAAPWRGVAVHHPEP